MSFFTTALTPMTTSSASDTDTDAAAASRHRSLGQTLPSCNIAAWQSQDYVRGTKLEWLCGRDSWAPNAKARTYQIRRLIHIAGGYHQLGIVIGGIRWTRHTWPELDCCEQSAIPEAHSRRPRLSLEGEDTQLSSQTPTTFVLRRRS